MNNGPLLWGKKPVTLWLLENLHRISLGLCCTRVWMNDCPLLWKWTWYSAIRRSAGKTNLFSPKLLVLVVVMVTWVLVFFGGGGFVNSHLFSLMKLGFECWCPCVLVAWEKSCLTEWCRIHVYFSLFLLRCTRWQRSRWAGSKKAWSLSCACLVWSWCRSALSCPV